MTLQTVRHVHFLTMNPVWQVAPHPDATDREAPGSWREHDIRPFSGGMKPPDWPLVPGYPPVIVLKTRRPHYLSAMERADAGDYGPLGEILARAMYDNLYRFIVPNVAGPARLVPLAALVDGDFSAAALRQAAQRGRLDAVQGADGMWRSSRRAVEDYARSKGRRRSTSAVVDQID